MILALGEADFWFLLIIIPPVCYTIARAVFVAGIKQLNERTDREQEEEAEGRA